MIMETETDVEAADARERARATEVLATLSACPGGLCLREIAARTSLDGGQAAATLARLEVADEVEADERGGLFVYRRR